MKTKIAKTVKSRIVATKQPAKPKHTIKSMPTAEFGSEVVRVLDSLLIGNRDVTLGAIRLFVHFCLDRDPKEELTRDLSNISSVKQTGCPLNAKARKSRSKAEVGS